jgi:succinyl-diaminopimelate desuccinylase
MMARAFGICPLLLGFGTPGGNAHGPDEAMDLPGWAAGVDTSAALLYALARPIRADHVTARLQSDDHKGSRSVSAGAPLARIHGEE